MSRKTTHSARGAARVDFTPAVAIFLVLVAIAVPDLLRTLPDDASPIRRAMPFALLAVALGVLLLIIQVAWSHRRRS